MMKKWRPWPPLVSRKYEVKLLVRTLHSHDLLREGLFAVEIRWKGPKLALSSLRRTAVARNFTKEAPAAGDGDNHDGVILWDEEFQSFCTLSAYKDNNNAFHPWEIAFTVFNGLNQRPKVPVIGTAFLNLAEFASAEEDEHVRDLGGGVWNGLGI